MYSVMGTVSSNLILSAKIVVLAGGGATILLIEAIRTQSLTSVMSFDLTEVSRCENKKQRIVGASRRHLLLSVFLMLSISTLFMRVNMIRYC